MIGRILHQHERGHAELKLEGDCVTQPRRSLAREAQVATRVNWNALLKAREYSECCARSTSTSVMDGWSLGFLEVWDLSAADPGTVQETGSLGVAVPVRVGAGLESCRFQCRIHTGGAA